MDACQTAPTPQSLVNIAALASLFELLGIQVSRQQLLEEAKEDGSLESLTECLKCHGQPARIVSVTDEQLSALPKPTLVMHRSGEALVLREVRRRSALLEQADGKVHWLALDAYSAEMSSLALELSPSLARSGTLTIRLLPVLGTLRPSFLRLGWLSFWLFALSVLGPEATRVVIDQALPTRGSGLLTVAVLAVLLVGLQNAWFGWHRERVLRNIEAELQLASVRDVFRHILALPYTELQRTGVGGLIQKLVSAEGAVALLMNSALLSLLDLVLAVGYCLVIASASPMLSASLVASSLVCLGMCALLSLRLGTLQKQETGASARHRGFLHEMLAGLMTIKAASALHRTMERWLGLLVEEQTLSWRKERLRGWLQLVLDVTRQGIGLAVFLWAGQACLAGSASTGEMLRLTMLATCYAACVARFGNAMVPAFSARAHLQEVDSILRIAPEASASPKSMEAADQDAIVLRDVWFRYGPGQPWILRGYNLRVQRGETARVGGPSGTGKTTVLRIIAGLQRPERGFVSVFGTEPIEARDAIAYLPQDAYMFEGSIEHNLLLLSRASRDSVMAAAEKTGLAAWVSGLPMGYETVISSGGGTLSGGQRQLIVLTAALASDRELLLMDESPSQTDRLLRSRLTDPELYLGKTVVAVSHEV